MTELGIAIAVCAIFVSVYIAVAVKNEKDKQKDKHYIHAQNAKQPIDYQIIRETMKGKKK